jgi:hypothetical protein
MIVVNRIETYLKALGLWVLFFGVSAQVGSSQIAYDNNWYIGYKSWGDPYEIGRWDFSNGLDIKLDTGLEAEFRGQNLTMSDRDGNLLFYSNGCKLWDADHEVIPGSDPLLPGEFHEEWCVGGSWKGMPVVNTMLGLPFELSEDSTIYYIYHMRDSFVDEPFFNIINFIREHSILHTDSGLEVLYTDSTVSNSFTYNGFFEAVRHANNRDWWLIHPLYNDTLFEASHFFESILIDEGGAHGGETIIESSHAPPSMNPRGRTGGQLVSNLSGDRLVSFGLDNDFFYMKTIV